MADKTVYKRNEQGKKIANQAGNTTAKLRFKERDIEISKIIRIGRSNDNDIVLKDDPLVSRNHAIIEKEGEHYYISDKDSKNGTYVNNNPLGKGEKLQLHSGDNIKIGKSKFKVL